MEGGHCSGRRPLFSHLLTCVQVTVVREQARRCPWASTRWTPGRPVRGPWATCSLPSGLASGGPKGRVSTRDGVQGRALPSCGRSHTQGGALGRGVGQAGVLPSGESPLVPRSFVLGCGSELAPQEGEAEPSQEHRHSAPVTGEGRAALGPSHRGSAWGALPLPSWPQCPLLLLLPGSLS